MLFCLTLLLHLDPSSCHAAAQGIALKGAQVWDFLPIFININKSYLGRWLEDWRKLFILKTMADFPNFVFFSHAEFALNMVYARWVFAKKRFTHSECALKKGLCSLSVFWSSSQKIFFTAGSACTNSKFSREKLQKWNNFEFCITIPKSPTHGGFMV